MTENERIFLEFWKNYKWPDQPKPQPFRLYHDDQGRPLRYSRDDEPGSYIELTSEEWNMFDMSIIVQDGKLVRPPPPGALKLRPSVDGMPCHHADVTIVVDPNSHKCQHWTYK